MRTWNVAPSARSATGSARRAPSPSIARSDPRGEILGTDEWGLVEHIQRLAATLHLPAGAVGSGDDAAVLPWTQGEDLVVSTDLIAEGTHFHPDTDPRAIGRFAVAVNLSDLAAMGATPRAFLGAVGAPRSTPRSWWEEVAKGLLEGLAPFATPLVGGDTKEAPGRVVVGTALGAVPQGKAIRRDGARVGDTVVVTGTLGGPGAAVHLMGEAKVARQAALARILDVAPRVAAGIALRDAGARGMIDTSDGVARAATLLARASGVHLELELDALPLDPWIREAFPTTTGDAFLDAAVGTGGEYELLATIPPDRLKAARRAVAETGSALTPIGRVAAGSGAMLRTWEGDIPLEGRGWRHLAGK